jgi:hypothetical protein
LYRKKVLLWGLLDLRSPRLIKIRRKKSASVLWGPFGFEISEADKNTKEKRVSVFYGAFRI